MAITMNCAERVSVLELADFPDEIILKVFTSLDLKDLKNCGKVSKRFRTISYDKLLWQRIDLSGQNVSNAFIQFALDRGCKCLDLDNSKLEVNLKLTEKSQLRHLYLQNCVVDDESLEQLISSCQFLETYLEFCRKNNMKKGEKYRRVVTIHIIFTIQFNTPQ